jgi:azurin
MYEWRGRQRSFASVMAAVVFSLAAARAEAQAPRILLDQPPRAVEYQLNRLTPEELVLVERKNDDVRYRPVYVALLTRKGIPPQFRDEAVAALTRMDKSSRSLVLLEALGRVPIEDLATTEKVAALLLGQPADALRTDRETFLKAIDDASASSKPLVLRAAYAALMAADGKPDDAWKLAVAHPSHLTELLLGIKFLQAAPSGSDVRSQLFTPISALLSTGPDVPTRAAALEALGWTRQDAATFELLAREVKPDADEATRNAAVASLERIPETAWPAAALEPLARALVSAVAAMPADRRTEPAGLDAIQFGEKLAAKLPDEPRRAVRRDLRALGVRVIKIQTIPEKLTFDVKWFVVEAGKPVQIVLFNPDAMPHNLIVGTPGSLEAIGTNGSGLPMPTDPDAKAFVPDLPAVLQATKLVREGETERLGFTAPSAPGEYIFVCTFPGHWVRMYGVMLVVESLDAFEVKPMVPTDPMTKQPFTSK